MGSGGAIHPNREPEAICGRKNIYTPMDAGGIHSPNLEVNRSKNRKGVLVNQDRFAYESTEVHDKLRRAKGGRDIVYKNPDLRKWRDRFSAISGH